MNTDSNSPANIIRVVQITDSHLGAEPGEQLMGLDTDESLAAVLALIAEEQNNTDLLLATGDISNHAGMTAYQRFNGLVNELAADTLWLPGNHDDPDLMAQALGEPLAKAATMGNWLILMLNSTVKDQSGGCLSSQELEFLKGQLVEVESGHVLICLHHHPVDIGCAWLDEQRLANAEAFFEVVDSCSQVRGILWGHVHQQFERERKGVKLMATPSSCIQFAVASEVFKLDRANPGYRWLELCPDGTIETAVSRVSGVEFNVNYDNSAGY